ncbi:MAG: protein translocase subunit SecF [Deltaproteobacteria bacterium]|nr:MAG: protein translocase subunit SecF [Deltaproteobacteria bacterium]
MEIIKPGININFTGRRKQALVFSLIMILISVIALSIRGGLNYGIDFAGGTEVVLKFNDTVEIAEIRDSLNQLNLGDVEVQRFGAKETNQYLIRIEHTTTELEGLSAEVESHLQERFGEGSLETLRSEMVGPKVGKDLRRKGMLAVLSAVIGMLIYITWRFELRFGVGAIIALIHDVVITLGVLALTNSEFNLPTIAALLTVVGYSVNDTIVISDRIRENLRKIRKKTQEEVVNVSINETLSRTILTSGTTLLVCITLFLLGGPVIHVFALVLIVGFSIGTYSSIFIATPVLLFWKERFPKKIRR